MPLRTLGLSLLLALLLPAPMAHATPLEIGAVARGFFTAHGRFGNFYGVESRLVRSGPLFLGVSGFGGPVLNAPRSALGYGGALAGANASKLGLTAGYLYMPNASDLSGATVGLRFAY